jgi:hypothetical protein
LNDVIRRAGAIDIVLTAGYEDAQPDSLRHSKCKS